MYIFECPNGHISFSAAKETYDDTCPTCGEETKLATPPDDRMAAHRQKAAVGKAFREKVQEMHDEGKSNQQIAEELDTPENRVRTAFELGTGPISLNDKWLAARSEGQSIAEIAAEQEISEDSIRRALGENIVEERIMWFPGMYEGRKGVYAKSPHDLLRPVFIKLVQQRAQEDGEWAIENGLTGQNDELMRKMMAWVSRPDVIKQCVNANLSKEDITIDWVCRELALASQRIARGVRP